MTHATRTRTNRVSCTRTTSNKIIFSELAWVLFCFEIFKENSEEYIGEDDTDTAEVAVFYFTLYVKKL